MTTGHVLAIEPQRFKATAPVRRKTASGASRPGPHRRLSRWHSQALDAPEECRLRYDPSRRVPHLPQNACPLVRPTGNFTVGPNADPRFAPEFASVLSSAFNDLNKRGITPYITSGIRTSADQARMRGGASGSNPAASVSNNQLGLSIDLNTRTPDFPTIRAVLTGAGLTWGGTFRSKDPPHFQLPPAGTRADRAQAAICEAENGR